MNLPTLQKKYSRTLWTFYQYLIRVGIEFLNKGDRYVFPITQSKRNEGGTKSGGIVRSVSLLKVTLCDFHRIRLYCSNKMKFFNNKIQ